MDGRLKFMASNEFLLQETPLSTVKNFSRSLEYLKSHRTTFSHGCHKVYLEKHKFVIKLEKLSLSSCSLLKFPLEILNLNYLTDLNLSNNFITDLPEEMANLYNLTSLNLSWNKLSYLPKCLFQVYQLAYLNLSHNFFFEVPDSLYLGLKNIRILDLSYNKIRNFNNLPKCSNKLIELQLSINMLENWPEWIFNSACQLCFLDLNENPLKLIKSPVIYFYNSGVFSSLQVLNIENCNFKNDKLQFLNYFRNLEILKIGNKNSNSYGKNDLRDLNMSVFKKCVKLKKLYLNNACISFLSASFDCIKSVEFLFLSENFLGWLPETFGMLIQLKVLNLSSNEIIFLPKDIGYLENLEEIYLQNNNLNQLPDTFAKLCNLKFIDLYNNKLEKIDLSILLIKSLRGIDLEKNCLNFNFVNCDLAVNEIKQKYGYLKQNYREIFGCKNRFDCQTLESDECLNELSNEPYTFNVRCIGNSFDDDSTSSLESFLTTEAQGCSSDLDDDWEEMNFTYTEDDFFDPNDDKQNYRGPPKSINLEFWNNFCPANDHIESVMGTCCKNMISSLQNEVMEGQFDSD